MYISQVFLDTRKHDTARALYNRNIMHGALERCFEGERQHPLWRIDKRAGIYLVLVVSKTVPDFTNFISQFGVSGIQPQTKSYDAFLTSGIRQGEIMRFHITANPTIKKNGKRIPLNLKRTEHQKYCASDWIKDRLLNHGAELITVDISAFESHKIRSEQKNIVMVSADFDGYLKVIDRDKFEDALKNGIGHGKAYGCGMLSVMKNR